jgi:nitrile hydratase
VDGIHDLGGMHGFGPVRVEADEPVFRAPWEGRVFGMGFVMGALGIANADVFRHAIERLDPVAYLTASYYGRWLSAIERLLVEAGVLGPRELEARLAGTVAAPHPPPALARTGPPGARRDVDTAARFALGDTVRTRNSHPEGHTRLPRYARGRRGTVVRVHPAWVFPDTNAHGRGEEPQYVYAVRFEGRELWGEDAEAATAVHVDVFESHLEPT